MDDIRRATVIELAGASLIIRAGVLDGSHGFTMIRNGRRLISEPPLGPTTTIAVPAATTPPSCWLSVATTPGSTSAGSMATPGRG
jgi:hypothetical protein